MASDDKYSTIKEDAKLGLTGALVGTAARGMVRLWKSHGKWLEMKNAVTAAEEMVVISEEVAAVEMVTATEAAAAVEAVATAEIVTETGAVTMGGVLAGEIVGYAAAAAIGAIGLGALAAGVIYLLTRDEPDSPEIKPEKGGVGAGGRGGAGGTPGVGVWMGGVGGGGGAAGKGGEAARPGDMEVRGLLVEGGMAEIAITTTKNTIPAVLAKRCTTTPRTKVRGRKTERPESRTVRSQEAAVLPRGAVVSTLMGRREGDGRNPMLSKSRTLRKLSKSLTR